MTMTNASHCELLSHHENRYYLTQEINHFPTSSLKKKKKREQEQKFCPSEASSLVIVPIVIHSTVSSLPVSPSTLQNYPHKKKTKKKNIFPSL